jgi:hypothetical protein
MPVIKPRTRGKEMVRYTARLDRENLEVLYAYAQFLGEPTDYILNQVIEMMLPKDKEFLAWRAAHPESYLPQPGTGGTGNTRDVLADRRDGARAVSAPLARDIEV